MDTNDLEKLNTLKKLEKLTEFKKDGLISEEEFEKFKNREFEKLKTKLNSIENLTAEEVSNSTAEEVSNSTAEEPSNLTAAEASKIKDYFIDINAIKKITFWLIWIAIGAAYSGWTKTATILFCVGAIFLAEIYRKLSSISDTEVDKLQQKAINYASHISLGRLNIDETDLIRNSLIIVGIRIFNTGGAPLQIKKGKDNKLRFSLLDIAIIHFTKNYIDSYTCAFDMTTGNILNESTDEYFYEDIVSVSTKTVSKIAGNIQYNDVEIFELRNKGGGSIEVVLNSEKWTVGENYRSTAQEAVTVLRKVLRDRKSI